jgi:hypothetical protein
MSASKGCTATTSIKVAAKGRRYSPFVLCSWRRIDRNALRFHVLSHLPCGVDPRPVRGCPFVEHVGGGLPSMLIGLPKSPNGADQRQNGDKDEEM